MKFVTDTDALIQNVTKAQGGGLLRTSIDALVKILNNTEPSEQKLDIVIKHMLNIYKHKNDYMADRRFGYMKSIAHLKQLLNIVGEEFDSGGKRQNFFNAMQSFLKKIKAIDVNGNVIYNGGTDGGGRDGGGRDGGGRDGGSRDDNKGRSKPDEDRKDRSRGDRDRNKDQQGNDQKNDERDRDNRRRVERTTMCNDLVNGWMEALSKKYADDDEYRKARYEFVKAKYQEMHAVPLGSEKREYSVECWRALANDLERGSVNGSSNRDVCNHVVKKWLEERAVKYGERISVGNDHIIFVLGDGTLLGYSTTKKAANSFIEEHNDSEDYGSILDDLANGNQFNPIEVPGSASITRLAGKYTIDIINIDQ